MQKLIEAYLREKNLDFKTVNGQYNLLNGCPKCGDPKKHHFYIDGITGLWDCKKCGASGNWNQFRDIYCDAPIKLPEPDESEKRPEPKEYKILDYEQVRKYSQVLWSGLKPEFLDYLQDKRQLEEATIKHFKLGLDNESISIPILDADHNLINIRRRRNPWDKTDGPRYTGEAGCKSILFNEGCLVSKPLEVYLTEGEFDAMQLWQRGLKNVVSTTLGANYFSPEWVDKLKDVKRVYICYDNDEPGREGAKMVADKIGHDKCRIVEIPKEPSEKKIDISDYFTKKGKTKKDFLELVKKAKIPTAFDEDSIKHIADYNDELREKLLAGDYTGISTGYDSLDKIMGGYRKGRVVVLSGFTSVGKTTFSQNLVLKMAARKLPCMYISMEMPPVDICKKFLQLQASITGSSLESLEEKTPLMATVDKGLEEFKDLPIYLFNRQGGLDLQVVMDTCRVAKETYNCELLVIDHLHYFAVSTGNRTAEVSAIIRQVKEIAMELDLPVLLLAHLNRTGKTAIKKGMVYIPTLTDLKESGSIEQDADQVVFVARDSESTDEDEKRKTVIKVAKNRDGQTGYTSMDFDLDIGFFSEKVSEDYLKAFERTSAKAKPITETLEDTPALPF